jgi:hypothetical protein
MDCFASLAMTADTPSHLAARGARRDAIGGALEIEEGAGKAGCPQHPRSCAQECTRVTARCAGTPGLPCAMVLTRIARSPGAEFLWPPSLTIGDRPKPGRARQVSISLTPATGARPHAFAVRGFLHQNARPAHVLPTKIPAKAFKRQSSARRPVAHKPKLALRFRRARRCRVHRIPHPTSVTIAIRPSHGRGMAGVVGVIWGNREAEYFCGQRLDQPMRDLPDRQRDR